MTAIAGRRTPIALIGVALVALLALVIVVMLSRGPDEGAGGGVDSESIAAGARLYEVNCARCHGVEARGGGPDAGTTAVRPPSLVSGHTASHSDEELFTVISEGLPGGMPAWQGILSEDDRRRVVQYLRSLQES